MEKERSKRVLLKGIPASFGVARGKVTVVTSPSKCDKMREGNILVAVETNPEYLPAILKASAIIADRGGMLSHCSIVAREFGIPGVVGTTKATKALKDGMIVIVDGEKGIVFEEVRK